MKKLVIIFCLVNMSLLFPQEIKFNDVPRDTFYTLYSAYQKYVKDYPFIKPVVYKNRDEVIMEEIVYDNSSGRPLSLNLFRAANEDNKLKPAVIMIHGGGWRSGDKSLMFPLAAFLAKKGIISIAVEYRLSPEAKYPAAIDDIKNAAGWVWANAEKYNIDRDKIAIMGSSAGAQMAGLTGFTYDKQFCAILNIDGIMDFTSEEVRKFEDDPKKKKSSAGLWFGGRYAEKPELWKEASPLYYVGEDSPPVLFINSSMPRFHCGRDEVIEKLNKYSIYSEVRTFEDAPHSFWLFEPWFERTGEYILDFMGKVSE